MVSLRQNPLDNSSRNKYIDVVLKSIVSNIVQVDNTLLKNTLFLIISWTVLNQLNSHTSEKTCMENTQDTKDK